MIDKKQWDKKWNDQYGRVKIWLHEHEAYPTKDKNRDLFHWVQYQRGLKNRRELKNKYIRKLDEIGFIWSVNEYKWNRTLEEFRQWRIENPGRWPSQRNHRNAGEKKLAIWMLRIGVGYKNGTLGDRRKKLEGIGYIFEDRRWRESYKKLCEYLEKEKEVPSFRKAKNLRNYCFKTFRKYKEQKLTKEQITMLERVDFFKRFGPIAENTFENAVESLCRYMERRGKEPAPGYALGKYGKYKFRCVVDRLKNDLRAGNLDKKLFRKLKSAGFQFQKLFMRENKWDAIVNDLKKFRKKHPDRWPSNKKKHEKEYRLALWCYHQRAWYNGKKKHYLTYSSKRKTKLDSINFNWDIRSCVRKTYA
jgi:hypothetical protein